MKKKNISAIMVLLVGPVLACEVAPTQGGGEGEPAGESRAEFRDSAGILPYPIKVASVGGSNQPVLSGGMVQPTWGGSMADLIAADAWATCTQGVGNATYVEQNDFYIDYLHDMVKSTANACAANTGTCVGNNCSLGQRWRYIRGQPNCNGYAGTGQTGALTFRPHGNAAYNMATSSSPAALQTAENELNVAEVNLCMAQKLREEMVSAPSLLLTTADHLELMAHTRSRAQLAMLQYAVIGTAINAPGTPANDGNFGPALRAWAAQASNAARVKEFGADAAAAIELHIEATREFGKFMAEQVSARPDALAGDGWGNGSWRARLMHLLYGGDPLGDYGTGGRWQVYKAGVLAGPEPTLFARVIESNESPQLQTLLGLARQADALYFVSNGSLVVDVEATAGRLFQAVEGLLFVPECAQPGSGYPTCEQLIALGELPTISNPTGSLLASKHGVTPDDVRSLVRVLSQAMPKVNPFMRDLPGAFRFTGAHAFLSSAEVAQQLPDAAEGHWFHLDPKFVALPFDLAERADTFAPYVGYNSLYYTGVEEPSQRDFLGSHGYGNHMMRDLGATAALAWARESFASQAKFAADAVPANVPFFQKVMAAMPLVGGAIGPRSVRVVPKNTAQKTYPNGLSDYHSQVDQMIVRQLMSNDYFGDPLSTVSVVTKKSDPKRTLVMAPTRPHEGIAGADPTFRSLLGEGHAAHFGPGSGAKFHQPIATTDLGFDDLEQRTYELKGELFNQSLFLSASGAYGPEARFEVVAQSAALPFETKTYKVVEFVSVAGQPPTLSEINRSFRLSRTGYYLAYGGSFGAMASNAWAVKPYNWAKPNYDGLGVKLDWFPPPLELTDAAPGESASSFFLREAAEAAGVARGKVAQLVENLLDVQQDEAAAETSRQLARAAEIFEKKRLCGEKLGGDPNACETGTVEVDLGAIGVVPALDPCAGDHCEWYGFLAHRLFPHKLRVLKPLKAYLEQGLLNNSAPPSFEMYNGGAMKEVLLKQWQALRVLRDAVTEFRQFLVSSQNEANAASAQVALAADQIQQECGQAAFRLAASSGFSYSYDEDELGVNCQGDAENYACANYFDSEGKSYSPGPFLAQIRACEAQKLVSGEALRAAIETLANLHKQLSGYVMKSNQTGDGVAIVTAEALRIAQDASLAAAKASLEAQRAQAELVTKFGTYRRFHMQDVSEAKSKLAQARRLSLYARRAVEADYVVDLSTLHSGFDGLPPPSTWADTVYDPVLDLGQTMGLAIEGGDVTVEQGPDRFTNYVSNLDDFRLGYALDTYSMVVSSENQLVDLPAPEKRIDQRTGGEGPQRSIVSEDVASWSFYCEDSQTWVLHPGIGDTAGTTSPLATLCGGQRPRKAKLSFHLDPWGRLDGDPYEQGDDELRYNTRIVQFAVNLEGEHVTTCGAGCTPPTFVNYRLSHIGPAWLSDYVQDLHAFDLPIGSTPSTAAALAKRQKLQLVGNDFDGGPASTDLNNPNVRRQEFRSRPLGASYELVFDVTPSVRLENITNVQLLFKTSSWVRVNGAVE